ncbi:hypothetical protein Taro_012895 [Colocasia esculenta]|uniref:Uncharacterized protein n=1 Tax=Colocasia esculenta TaxID=4460 RepID=A0A843UEW4_COLES|nr:hypothetical protein [Colocasia esculenta]
MAASNKTKASAATKPAARRRRHETAGGWQQHAAMDVDYDKMEETESDNRDLQEEEDDNEEDEEKMEMEYRLEYHQRPAGVDGAAATTASNGATGESSISFVAMVQ